MASGMVTPTDQWLAGYAWSSNGASGQAAYEADNEAWRGPRPPQPPRTKPPERLRSPPAPERPTPPAPEQRPVPRREPAPRPPAAPPRGVTGIQLRNEREPVPYDQHRLSDDFAWRRGTGGRTGWTTTLAADPCQRTRSISQLWTTRLSEAYPGRRPASQGAAKSLFRMPVALRPRNTRGERSRDRVRSRGLRRAAGRRRGHRPAVLTRNPATPVRPAADRRRVSRSRRGGSPRRGTGRPGPGTRTPRRTRRSIRSARSS